MRGRPTGLLVLALPLLALALLAACTPEKRFVDRDPEYFGIDIVFCERKVESSSESCAEIASAPSATIFANVLADKAGGRVVLVETDGPVLGTVKRDPVYVRRGETLSQWIEISRDGSCRELPCAVSISVYVDDELILTESISFI